MGDLPYGFRGLILRLFLLSILFCLPLFAYLDPGSGSLLLSSIVALFASLVFFIKNAFYRLISSPLRIRPIFNGGGESQI